MIYLSIKNMDTNLNQSAQASHLSQILGNPQTPPRRPDVHNGWAPSRVRVTKSDPNNIPNARVPKNSAMTQLTQAMGKL
jgi:hypothetical protein